MTARKTSQSGVWIPCLAAMTALVAAMATGCGGSTKPPAVSGKGEGKAAEAGEHRGDGGGKEKKQEKEERVTLRLDQQKANRFDFSPVVLRAVARTIRTTGTIAANEPRIARVRPLARGRILEVKVRVGDAVRKGQELLTFDNIELGEAIGEFRRSQAALEKARTEAAVAQRTVERARNLIDLGGIARSELDKRDAEAKNAQAAIQELLTQESILHEKLHRFGLADTEIDALAVRRASDLHRTSSIATVRAPQDGVVLKVTASEGEGVQPETQMFEILDTSTVWVLADVPDRDLGGIRLGSTVAIHVDSYPDETFTGRVTHVGDAVDPNTRTAKIRCEAANPGRRLKLDMFATIEFPASGERQALMVPGAAIQKVEGRTVVFVKESEEEFVIRPVQTGAALQGWTEIVSGLKAGETVVLRGSFVLKAEHEKSELGEHDHD